MKIRTGIFLVLGALLVGMALTFGYMKIFGSAPVPLMADQSRPAIPPLMITAKPITRTFIRSVPWVGTVETQVSVALTALTDGTVAILEVGDQSPVAAGQLVARLSGPQVSGQRARLLSEVESLQSQLSLAQQTVARQQKSLQVQLVTKDQVAETKAAQVALQARLRQARLNMETFEKQIGIVAPISGIFTNRRISAGQDVAAGQVIGDILGTGSLRIEASLFLPSGIDLVGKEATVRMDRDAILSGRVQCVLPRADSTGATVVWIEGKQIDGRLRPGQSVGGSLTLEVRPAVLAVPESAIVYDEKEHPVVFIQQDGIYELRSVQLGLMQDGWIEVVAGVKANQSVVIQGAYELFYQQFNEQFKVPD